MDMPTTQPQTPQKRAATAAENEADRTPHWVWSGKVLPAFWTVGSALSLILNLILIVTLISVGKQLFTIKKLVQNQLIGGLYANFILMDQANIETTVNVDDTIPVQFQLPVRTQTTVRLTEPVLIRGASVSLSTGGLNIVQAPTDIILPADTLLPIALDIMVPVDTTIPVVLTVPVDIPLDETDLHGPFVGLQEVISPYYWLLDPLPDSWAELFSRYP